MMEEISIKYCLCRDVREPRRASKREAGIDFFIPKDLDLHEMEKINPQMGVIFDYDEDRSVDVPVKVVTGITLGAGSRVLIPSGVRALISPPNSMLMAANKSGISTKKGLIYGAEIVDSTYTGEIHLSIINTTHLSQVIDFNKAILQFIHVPVFLTEPKKITDVVFEYLSSNWSERGSNWQGSTDNIK